MKRPTLDDPLLQTLALNPTGLSVSEISERLALSRRTLQRRLRQLLDAGLLVKRGNSRATRYSAAAEQPCQSPHTLVAEYRPDAPYLPAALQQRFLALSRKLHTRHASAFRAQPDTRLTALFWPCWSRTFIWNSARLAGGRYPYTEAEEFLETGTPAPHRPSADAQTLLNLLEAIRYVAQNDARLDELTLRNLHAMLTDNLLADPAEGGTLRTQAYGEPPQHPAQVLRLVLERCRTIEAPFEQSFFLFLHVSRLQLFTQANARLARVLANLPLLQADHCPLVFNDISPDQYRQAFQRAPGQTPDTVRELYRHAYEASCRYFETLPVPGGMNPLRLRYRKELGSMVREIVLGNMNRQEAGKHIGGAISDSAPGVPEALGEVVLQELEALHAGNIYRYRLQIDDLLAWKRQWAAQPLSCGKE